MAVGLQVKQFVQTAEAHVAANKDSVSLINLGPNRPQDVKRRKAIPAAFDCGSSFRSNSTIIIGGQMISRIQAALLWLIMEVPPSPPKRKAP